MLSLLLLFISAYVGLVKMGIKRFLKDRYKFLKDPIGAARRKRNSIISSAKNSLKRTVSRSLTDFGNRGGLMRKLASKMGKFALGLDGKGRRTRRSGRKRRVRGRGLRTFAAMGLKRRQPAIAHRNIAASTASGLFIPRGRK